MSLSAYHSRSSFIDFHSTLPDGSMEGWIEKKGSGVNTMWKKRYAILSGGLLKFYKKEPSRTGIPDAADFKGQVLLQGATVSSFKVTRLQIQCCDDKRTTATLRTTDSTEASLWQNHITKEIDRANIIALKSGSRLPEVVEWYYRHQTEVSQRVQPLEVALQAVLTFSASGRSAVVKRSDIWLSVTMDRQGLCLRFDEGRKLDSVENRLNGRVIDFKDILGVNIETSLNASGSGSGSGSISGRGSSSGNSRAKIPPTGGFSFTLVTREEPLALEFTKDGGGPWLTALQESLAFMLIPPPPVRSSGSLSSSASPLRPGASFSDRSPSIASASQVADFRSVSESVFHSSGDVQMFLQGLLNGNKFQFPIISEVATLFLTALRLLADVKCNKEVACQFGERLEDVVRVLADTKSGVLIVAKSSDGSLIFFHMTALCSKLKDCVGYLHSISTSGWLGASMKPINSANSRYKSLDAEITSIANLLIRAVGDPRLAFSEVRYEVGIDVRKSVQALGGIDGIYRDVSKQRALAQLLQAVPGDVMAEVQLMMSGDAGPGDRRVSLSSSSSSLNSLSTFRISESTGLRETNGSAASSSWSSSLCRFFCCFGGRRRTSTSGQKVELEKRLIQ